MTCGARLRATRFAAGLDKGDGFSGWSTACVRPLVEYWADGFDWRAAEKQLSNFRQYRIAVGGTPVHFIREPGRGPAPIPIIRGRTWRPTSPISAKPSAPCGPVRI